MNYLGQLRLYSFVDLILLLLATHTAPIHILGALILWLGFLLLLESRHKHSYRKQFPSFLMPLLLAFGLILYGRIEGLIFILLGYLYSQKTGKSWGIFSPLIRGLQPFVAVGGLLGYRNPLTWWAFGGTVIRNLLGDVRDVAKDTSESMKTIPIALGLKTGPRYIHLAGTLATSSLWCYLGHLPLPYLIIAWIIEITTYNWTPR